MTSRRHRVLARVLAVAALVVPTLAAAGLPADAESYVPITGAGSTWSQVAIDAWRADVRANGLVVNYSGTGSSDGRGSRSDRPRAAWSRRGRRTLRRRRRRRRRRPEARRPGRE